MASSFISQISEGGIAELEEQWKEYKRTTATAQQQAEPHGDSDAFYFPPHPSGPPWPETAYSLLTPEQKTRINEIRQCNQDAATVLSHVDAIWTSRRQLTSLEEWNRLTDQPDPYFPISTTYIPEQNRFYVNYRIAPGFSATLVRDLGVDPPCLYGPFVLVAEKRGELGV